MGISSEPPSSLDPTVTALEPTISASDPTTASTGQPSSAMSTVMPTVMPTVAADPSNTTEPTAEEVEVSSATTAGVSEAVSGSAVLLFLSMLFTFTTAQ